MTPEKLQLIDGMLSDLKDQIILVLDAPEEGQIRLVLISKVDVMKGFIGSMTGIAPSDNAIQGSAVTPMKDFMGEAIRSISEPITDEQIVPDQARIQEFQAKVLALKAALPGLTADQVFNSYKAEPLVIRGLAKMAGVENVMDRELDVVLLSDIREGLRKQDDATLAQLEFELKMQNAGNNEQGKVATENTTEQLQTLNEGQPETGEQVFRDAITGKLPEGNVGIDFADPGKDVTTITQVQIDKDGNPVYTEGDQLPDIGEGFKPQPPADEQPKTAGKKKNETKVPDANLPE